MKNNLKKITALVLAVIMVFSFVACGSKAADPNEVIAKVNDVSITRGQVEGFTDIYTYMLGYEPSEVTDDQLKLIVEDYVNVEVCRQYFAEKGLDIYPETYDDEVAAFIESAHTEGAEFLESNEVTDEHLADFYDAQYVTNAILSEIMEEYTEEDLRPDAEEYYETYKATLEDSETGEVPPIDEYLESIYYILYQEIYLQMVETLKADMTVEIM
ncbi:MAG: SurA N-terminal domain-containing protein [Firmicutes bacterium]|nr:SurA N-terminal domain-containing protein [Bacillota bacterium]